MTHTIVPIAMLAIAGGTFILAAVLTAIARRVALRIGFVDNPGGHKSHRAAMPYAGGCAIVGATLLVLGGFFIALAVAPSSWFEQQLGARVTPYLGGARERFGQMLFIAAGLLALHLLGLRDDRRPLPPTPKLLAIIVVAGLVSWLGDVRIGEALVGQAGSIILTVLWFVVIVNSLNFLDNMDGLSAGVGSICLLAIGVCGVMAGQVFVPALACIFAGAVAGFLFWNFPPARIFMGDAGSLVVGYMLATTSVLTTYYKSDAGSARPYALLMPFVILAVPLYDFTSVVVIRLLEGRNPMKGDQRHFSHRLVERGLSRRLAVLTIYLATATTGLLATLLPGAGLRETLSIGAVTLMVLAIVAILEMPLRRDA